MKLFNSKDPWFTLVAFATICVVIKFMAAGITFTVGGVTVNLGNVEAMAYGSLLTPILAAHGYIKGKKPEPKEEAPCVDKN